MAQPTGDKYRQRFIQRNMERAKAQGLTKDEFTFEFSKELKRFDTDRGQRQDKGFLGNLALALANPFRKTGRNIAAAASEVVAQPQRKAAIGREEERTKLFEQAANLARQAQEATDEEEKQTLLEESRALAESAGGSQVSDLPKGAANFFSEQQLGQIDEDPLKFLGQEGIKPAAGVAAFAAPAALAKAGVGAGLGVAAKGALAGGVAGGLQGFAQTAETATPLETVISTTGSTVFGAAAGAVTAKFADKLARKVSSVREARAHKKEIFRSIHEISKRKTRFLKPSDLDVPSWSEENFVKRAGTRLVGSQTGVPAPLGRTVNAQESFRKMSDYGFTNADYWDDTASWVTGRDGFITKMTQNAIGSADDVGTDDILKMTTDMLADEPLIVPAKRKTTSDFLKRVLIKMSGGSRGRLNPNAEPQAVFEAIKQLEGKAAQVSAGRPPWSVTPEDRSIQRVLKLTADELKDRLFEPSILDDAGVVLTQKGGANNAVVKIIAEQLDDVRAVSPALADDLAAAQNVSQLRNIAKPFVDASKIAREALNTGGSPFYTLGLDRPKGLGRLLGGLGRSIPFAEAALESRPVTAGAGQAIRGIGTAAQTSGLLGLPARAASAGLGAIQRGAEGALGALPTTTGAVAPVFGGQALGELQRRLQTIGRATPEQEAKATGRF